jgi:bacterioferritin
LASSGVRFGTRSPPRESWENPEGTNPKKNDENQAESRPNGESTTMNSEIKVSRERMVELLNEDLAREFQAVIAYVVYSQTIKGAAFTDIAGELAVHASEELSHALQITKQIDYFNGTPTTTPKEVKLSDKAEDMLRFDLENEQQTIVNYRQRIRQAEQMGEFALSEVLRKIIAQEQEHLTDLADALGIDNPTIEG